MPVIYVLCNHNFNLKDERVFLQNIRIIIIFTYIIYSIYTYICLKCTHFLKINAGNSLSADIFLSFFDDPSHSGLHQLCRGVPNLFPWGTHTEKHRCVPSLEVKHFALFLVILVVVVVLQTIGLFPAKCWPVRLSP